MGKFKIVTLCLFLICVVFTVLIYFSGVILSVENRSNDVIREVSVRFETGSILVGDVPCLEERSKYLGKIGEGSIFEVKWKNALDEQKAVTFWVYFYSLDFFTDVRIIFEADGSVELFEGDNRNEPVDMR